MGKKSRRVKAKTSDFQKVKLKVGKKRPLPSNVTEVAFKSQGIYVPEQMKNVLIDETSIEGSVSSKHNAVELLTQIGHFNSNFRVDALTSLRNFFSNNKNLIQQYLPRIIEKATRTIADEEQQVRKSSIAFFRVIFSNLSEQEMSPFFEVLLSHLYCAMSHIFDDIQKDSLQVVDLCIECFPNLLSHDARNTLLQHFIELISTKQTKSAASVKGAKGNAGVTRVLSMKLSNKESSIIWRNRILKRLNDLLKISMGAVKTSEKSNEWLKFFEESYERNEVNYNEENGINVRWNSNEIGGILTHFESQKMALPPFTLRSNPLSSISSLTDTKESDSSPWELIKTLFPLLFDCWHEATSDDFRSFSAESVETMNYVLNVVNLLLKRYLDSTDDEEEAIANLRMRYMKDFRQYFFESFPLSEFTGRLSNAKRKKATQVSPANVQRINLSTSVLVTTLASENTLSEDSEMLAMVATYLSMVLMSAGSDKGQSLDPTALEESISAIQKLLDIAVDDDTRENLLHPLLLLYQTLSSSSEEKSRLVKFFFDLYSDEKFSRNATITDWLCSLPDMLIEILSTERKPSSKMGTLCSDLSTSNILHLSLSCIRHACLREDEHLFKTLEEKDNVLLEILRDSANVLFCSPQQNEGAIRQCKTCPSIQARLFEVFVHQSRQISPESVTVISQICHGIHIVPGNVVYVCEMFLQRYKNTKSSEELMLVMKLLCSILLGISKQDFQSLQCTTADSQSYKVLNTAVMEFRCHSQIVEKICQILPTIQHMATIMQNFLCEKILKTNKTIPAKSVYAILKTGEMLVHSGKLQPNESKALAENFGKLVADILLCCHNSSDFTLDTNLQETLVKSVTALIQDEEKILRQCVEHLMAADLQDPIIWNSACLVIQTLTSNSLLNENLLQCQTELNNLMESLKCFCKNKTSESLFQETMLPVSLLLQKKNS